MNKYIDMVNRVQRSEDGWQKLSDEMTPHKVKLMQIVMGLSGEVGEIVSTIKKHLEYTQDLDMDNLEEEFGDLYWYFRASLITLGLDYDKIQDRNLNKLNKRYPDGYTNELAKRRLDKDE